MATYDLTPEQQQAIINKRSGVVSLAPEPNEMLAPVKKTSQEDSAILQLDANYSYEDLGDEIRTNVTGRNSAAAFAKRFRNAQDLADSPDALADNLKLAKSSGIPLQSVQTDPKMRNVAEKRAQYFKGKVSLPEKVRYAVDNRMYAYEFLMDPGNMALITDAPESLIESEGVFATAVRGYSAGDAQQRLGRLNMRQLLGESDPAIDAEIEKIKDEMQSLFTDAPEGLFGKAVFGAGKLMAQKRDQFARGLTIASVGMGVVALGVATGGIGLAPAAGALLTTGGAAAGAGATALLTSAANVGFMTGAAYEGFMMEAGLAYDELKEFRDSEGNPLEDSIARTGAFIVGAMNAGLEAAQFGIFLKAFPGISKLLPIKEVLANPSFKSFLGVAGKAAVTYASTLIEESATEVLQEGSNIIVGEIAKKISGGDFQAATKEEIVERLTETFASSMIEFSLPLIPGPLMGGVNNTYRIAAAREQKLNNAKVFSQTQAILNEQARESLLTKRDPGKMREFLSGMSDRYGYPHKEIYIPAKAVQEYMDSNGLNHEQRLVIMEDLFGSNMDDLTSSAAVGADLTIRSENIAVASALDPQMIEILTPKMKAEADGVEIGNIESATEEHKSRLRNEVAFANALTVGSMTEEELQAKAKEVGLDHVYLPAEAVQTFYQESGGEDLNAALEAMGVSETDFNRALESGDDIEISTTRLISGEIPEKMYEKLKENMRVEPQAMSLRDAMKYENEDSVLYSREEAAGWREHAEKQLDVFESGLKVQANVKAQLTLAGYDDAVSDASAKIFASHIMRSAERLGIDPQDYFKAYANVEFVGGVAEGDLRQPLMTNLPLDMEITPVRGELIFQDEPIWQIRKNFPSEIREKVKDAFKDGVINKNTGLKWHLGMNGLKHIMATAGNVEVDIKDRHVLFNAINNLSELAEQAIRVEVHEDKKPKDMKHPNDKGEGSLSKIHLFLAPFMNDDETIHILKITGKEYRGGFKPDEILLYDQKHVKSVGVKTKSLNDSSSSSARQIAQDASGSTATRPFSAQDFVQISIREMVSGVKDSDGNVYLQPVYHKAPQKIQGTIDNRYFAAIEADDMDTAQRIVDDQMRRNGYISNTDYRLNHRAPSHHDADVSARLDNVFESDIVPSDFWTNPHYYMSSNEVPVFRRVLSALKSKEQVIKMYRAIPKGVKENSFRNGDWITPSLDYVRGEGELIGGGYRIIEQTVSLKDVWWDANSINEFGYDDGNSYTYKDTKNNKKLTDTVVRDKSGNIVPPSKRFNQRKKEEYYQPHKIKPDPARGSITLPGTFGAGERIQITISPNANASTAVHEMAHFFLWETERLSEILPNDQSLQDDLDTIRYWWEEGAEIIARRISESDRHSEDVRKSVTAATVREWLNSEMSVDGNMGKALRIETHEYFARGFETYLQEGKAPSVGLLNAFRRFKKWLTDIYKSMLDHDVQLSESVKDVFDRMLATEEEVEAASLAGKDVTEQESLVLNIVSAHGENLSRQQQEQAKETILAEILQKNEDRKKERQGKAFREAEQSVYEEVLSMPIYRAAEAMKSRPEMMLSTDSLINDYGFEVFDGLPPEIHSSEGKARADDIAAAFGYGSGDEMLQKIKDAPSIEQEVQARLAAIFGEGKDNYRELIQTRQDEAQTQNESLENMIVELEDLTEARNTSREEWDEILRADEEAKAEQNNPKSRPNVIAWIKNNGGLKYDHVLYVFGKEDTRELARKLGPGIWSRKDSFGMGLDIVAESMSLEGAYFSGDQEIFNILMGDNPQQSPLDIAWNEGFAAARQYVRERREKSKNTSAERDKTKAEQKAFREEMKHNAQAKAEAMLSVAGNAVERIPHTQIGDKVKAYKAAETVARKEYREAVKAMDWEKAINAKDREILNRVLTTSAKDAVKDVAKARARITNLLNRTRQNSEWIPQEWVNQIDALMVRYNLMWEKPYMENTMGLDMWCESRERSGVPAPVVKWIRNGIGRREWINFTVQESRDLDNTFAWLVHDGRESMRLSKEFERRNLDEVAEGLATTIQSNWRNVVDKNIAKDAKQKSFNRSWKDDVESFNGKAVNRLRKVEFIARALDGGEKLGPVWEAIFRPTAKAEERESAMVTRYTKDFSKIFDESYTKQERKQMSKEKYWKRIDMNLSHENLIAIGLNMGNEMNMERARSGFEGEKGEAMMSIAQATLSTKDWAFIQKIWDLLDSLWPDIAALQRDIIGFVPERVEPRKFKVHPKDATGTQKADGIILRGGYYPIAYDRNAKKNRFIRMMGEQEATQAFFETQWSSAYTKHGFTERRAATTGLQLRLDLGVIPQHLMEVIHDLSYRKAVIDVNKIIRHQSFQAAVISSMGEETYNQLQPWLQSLARDDYSPSQNYEAFFRWARRRTQVVVLGVKAAVSLMQGLGFFPAAHEVGALPLMKNILYFYRNPLEVTSKTREIWDKSEAMRQRSESRDRDLRAVVRDLHKKGQYDSIQESYFYFINLFDAGVVLPIWVTAYEKAMQEYDWNESKAIEYADSVVRNTQDIGTPKDLAGVQRGSDLWKIFTMFYNAMNTQLNMLLLEADLMRIGKGSMPRMISALFWVVVAPAVAAEMIRGKGPGGDPDDDEDDENVLAWMIKTSLMQTFGMVPIVRDVAQAFDWGEYTASPAFAPMEDTVRAVNSYAKAYGKWKDEEDVNYRQVGMNTLMMSGYIFGLPAGQARITINAFLDWLEGEKEVKPQDFFLYRKR